MRKFFVFFVLVCWIVSGFSLRAQSLIPSGKKIYIPREFKNTDFNDPANRYSYHRMAYTDDIVVFWEAGFGEDMSNAPDLNGKSMKVDVNNILKQTERFYRYYRDTLKFIYPGSKADSLRMMVMVNYSEEGTAYGGSMDDVIGALWVTPSRLQDPKLNAVAHELGHSFQAQIGADHGNSAGGGSIWEMTSQWMLWQVNPLWMTDENYHWVDYMKQTHFALMHSQNMYHSPYMLEYWSNKHGLTIISDLWNQGTRGEDVVQTYQRLTQISQEQFNAEVFDAAQKFMTYDLDRIREVARPYANKHHSQMKAVEDGWYQISDAYCLQNYGYNGIQLTVPAPGKTVKISFAGLKKGQGEDAYALKTAADGKGGWRYGLVAVDKDDKPTYSEMYTDDQGTFKYRVPKKGLSYLWLVVSSAPEPHSLDTQKQWPYKVSISGTTLHENAIATK